MTSSLQAGRCSLPTSRERGARPGSDSWQCHLNYLPGNTGANPDIAAGVTNFAVLGVEGCGRLVASHPWGFCHGAGF